VRISLELLCAPACEFKKREFRGELGDKLLQRSSVLCVWLGNSGVPPAACVEDLSLRLQVVEILIHRGGALLQASLGSARLDLPATEVFLVSNEFEDEGL